MQMRAVRLRVVQAAVIALAREALAEVREPEPAAAIEHDVVRTAEPFAVERLVEALEAAGREIDALDAAGRVVSGRAQRQAQAVRYAPLEAAVVAHVDRAVRPDAPRRSGRRRGWR